MTGCMSVSPICNVYPMRQLFYLYFIMYNKCYGTLYLWPLVHYMLMTLTSDWVHKQGQVEYNPMLG